MAHDRTLALPTADDIALYEVHFGVHSEEGFVGAMGAKACLEEASGGTLSNQVLAGIWVICDADGDGHLGKLEFYLAVHIVLHMTKRQLTTVPHITPALLDHLTDALKASVTSAPQAAPTNHSTGALHAGDEDWRINAAAVAQFSQMFADACAAQGPGTDRLGKAEAGAVLAMSGLPTEVLLQIWSLADVNGDDRLDLRGYLLCCWLVQRSVQRQLPPPASLPPQLLASATAAVVPHTEPQPALAAAAVEDGFGFDGGGFGDANFGDGFSNAPTPALAPALAVAPAPAPLAAFGGDFSDSGFGDADFGDAGFGGDLVDAAPSTSFAPAAAPAPPGSLGFEGGTSSFGDASGFGDSSDFGDFGGGLVAAAPDIFAAAPDTFGGSVSQVYTQQPYTGPYALQMEQLVDMGLSDLEANCRELERNNGDITATVTSLLGTAGGSG